MSTFSRKLLFVEDDRLLCASLAEALRGHGFDTRCAFCARDAKRELTRFDPDIVIADIDLGSGPTGIDFLSVVRRQNPDILAILLSKHPDAVSAGHRPADIPSGVAYLRKSLVHDTTALVAAIDQAVRDHAAPPRHDTKGSSGLDALTTTQREVLRLMSLGLSNQEIANRRGVSVSAVEQRITDINRALGITSDGTTVPRVLAIREYIQTAGLPRRL